jgi:hypothetical protein
MSTRARIAESTQRQMKLEFPGDPLGTPVIHPDEGPTLNPAGTAPCAEYV